VFTYHLTKDELQALNNTKLVTVNPMRSGQLPLDKAQDHRIENVDITVVASHSNANNGTINLVLAHDWYSAILMNNKLYLFRHGSSDSQSAWTWAADYDVPTRQVHPESPSSHDQTLFASLLNKPTDYDLYTQPSAWSALMLSREDLGLSEPIQLTEVQLTLHITYIGSPEGLRFSTCVHPKTGNPMCIAPPPAVARMLTGEVEVGVTLSGYFLITLQ
jgi:hypothetical protein